MTALIGTVNPRNDRANLLAWGVAHPRPGHMTEYLDRYAVERRQWLRRELGRWIVVAIAAAGLAVY